jgi:glycosyltransferase involved in cell wall biosynthesis
MRVLLVNDYAPGTSGGVEVYLERLVAGLRAAGDDVELFAGEVSHNGLARALDFWDPFSRRALAIRAERFRPDVVHHHSVLIELSVSVLGVPDGVPCVVTVHDQHVLGAIHRPGQPLRSAADRWLKAPLNRRVMRRRADVLLAVSDESAGWLRAAGFPRVEGSSAIAGDPLVPPQPVGSCADVVFVGRFAADKGAVEAVHAFRQIRDRHPQSRLLLAGDGPERAAIAAVAAADDRVRLLGQLSARDVSELLGRARVVALPFRPEVRRQASPLTVVEAAMHGRPLVVGDDPAVREVAEHLGAVDVVSARRTDDLAGAIDRLLTDPTVAMQQGAEVARVAAATYAVPVVTAAHRRLYRRLIADRGR